MATHLITEAPGAMTTVQDLGRVGSQALGIPVSGALDFEALRLANALVGNASGTGCLEIRFLGPTLRVQGESARVALFGSSVGIELLGPKEGMVAPGQSVTLDHDQRFRIGTLRDSATAYLAVAGGFDLPDFFGSQSTYTPGVFGGFEGRAIRAGDVLPLNLVSAPVGPDLELVPEKIKRKDDAIRVVIGPQADYFHDKSIEGFLSSSYRVSDRISRMGLRLEGPPIKHSRGHDIPSDGVVTGSIQVPGNGLPIVLLADRQTTGGYPKIATVISADLPKLARVRPGAEIRFRKIEIGEAEQIRIQCEDGLLKRIGSMVPVGSHGQITLDALLHHNLISGVVSGDQDPTGPD